MSGSTGTQPPAEWYLARDGQQFGPLSDAELKKLVEFGHLKPTDLLWREGFPDWRSARILLPNAPKADVPQPPPAAPQPQAQPQSAQQPYPAQPDTSTRPAQTYQPVQRGQQPAPGPHPGQSPQQALPGSKPGGWQQQPWPQENPVPQQQQLPSPGQRPQQAGLPGEQPRAPIMPGPRPQLNLPNASQQGFPQQRQAPGQAPGSYGQGAVPPQGRGYAPQQPVADNSFDDYDDDFDEPSAKRGSRVVLWVKRAAVFIFFVSTLSAATWYAYPHRDRIMSIASAVTNIGGGEKVSMVSPIVGFAATPEATDQVLQKTALWRTLKRDFPDWYATRLKEAADLAREQKSDAVIGQKMMESVVALRRQYAGDALSATPPRIKAIATAFAENLTRLRSQSVEACFGFISNGETSSSYLQLLAQPEQTGPLQGQLNAVFEAIAEGRKLPRVYPPPKQTDYNILVTTLEARGWSEADMQLFSDSRALAKASPEKVCQMVTDWFQSQLSVKDADAQLRLLVDALKPVVAG